jgi:hypothetical protein
MARVTIKTRDFGELIFHCSDDPLACGYVTVREAGKGRDPKQPCDGGGFRGSTLMARPETLRKVAYAWIRQRRASEHPSWTFPTVPGAR